MRSTICSYLILHSKKCCYAQKLNDISTEPHINKIISKKNLPSPVEVGVSFINLFYPICRLLHQHDYGRQETCRFDHVGLYVRATMPTINNIGSLKKNFSVLSPYNHRRTLQKPYIPLNNSPARIIALWRSIPFDFSIEGTWKFNRNLPHKA